MYPLITPMPHPSKISMLSDLAENWYWYQRLAKESENGGLEIQNIFDYTRFETLTIMIIQVCGKYLTTSKSETIWLGFCIERKRHYKMFCINFNYGECKAASCDQPHWCAICFEFGHNARNHKHGSPLQDVSSREIRWFFGGWLNPLLMMYNNPGLWFNDHGHGSGRILYREIEYIHLGYYYPCAPQQLAFLILKEQRQFDIWFY